MRFFDAIFRFALLAALTWAVVSVYAGCAYERVLDCPRRLNLRVHYTTPSVVHRVCHHADWVACSMRPVNYPGPCEIWTSRADISKELCECDGQAHCDGGDEVAANRENWN